MKILVFGIGKYYENRKTRIKKEHIIGFVDNNPQKQGREMDGKFVYSPEQMCELEYDYILLMTIHFEEIKEQLKTLPVSMDKVITFGQYEILALGESWSAYRDDDTKSEFEDMLLGRRNCTSGSELWSFYEKLHCQSRSEEQDKLYSAIFRKQLELLDAKHMWE